MTWYLFLATRTTLTTFGAVSALRTLSTLAWRTLHIAFGLGDEHAM